MNSKVLTSVNKPDPSDSLPPWRKLQPEVKSTRLAVLGYPVHHSRSPEMHNAALREMERSDAKYKDWKYFRSELPPAELREAISAFHTAQIRGLNLTIPHKTDILPFIRVSPSVQRMGAANTLLWTPDGYVGYNSDGIGLERALKRDFDLDLKGLTVLMLGAGGAARATTLHLLEKEVRQIFIVNRSRDRAETIIDLARQAGWDERVAYLSPSSKEFPKIDVVINATSLGLKPADPAPIDLSRLPGKPSVYDMIYNPPETSLLKQAMHLGCPHSNGLSMLAYQGIESLRIWTEDSIKIPEGAFLLALGLAES